MFGTAAILIEAVGALPIKEAASDFAGKQFIAAAIEAQINDHRPGVSKLLQCLIECSRDSAITECVDVDVANSINRTSPCQIVSRFIPPAKDRSRAVPARIERPRAVKHRDMLIPNANPDMQVAKLGEHCRNRRRRFVRRLGDLRAWAELLTARTPVYVGSDHDLRVLAIKRLPDGVER